MTLVYGVIFVMKILQNYSCSYRIFTPVTFIYNALEKAIL